VKFASLGYGGLDVLGSLVTTGDQDNPVYFTSWKDDSVGGDTNGDGSGSAPSPGDWLRVSIKGPGASGTFSNTFLRYGGNNYLPAGYNALRCENATLNFTGGGVSDSYQYGIYAMGGGTVQIAGASFRNNGYAGVYLGGIAAPSVSGCTFSANAYGLYESSCPSAVVNNNVFDNNAAAGLWMNSCSQGIISLNTATRNGQGSS